MLTLLGAEIRRHLLSLHRLRQRPHQRLLGLDNHFSAKTALRNVNAFVQERVDFVIEFQTLEKAATALSARLQAAGIPYLGIEMPHPQAPLLRSQQLPRRRHGEAAP